MKVGPIQKAAIFLVISEIVPGSFIEIFPGNAWLKVVTTLLQENGVHSRCVSTEKERTILVIAKSEVVAIQLREMFISKNWKACCQLMETPESFADALNGDVLPDDFYPVDMEHNALLRIPLSKKGNAQEAEYVRGLMKKVHSLFPELYEEIHLMPLV